MVARTSASAPRPVRRPPSSADELTDRSEDFVALWGRGDVEAAGQMRKEVDHPAVGAMHFESTHLNIPARPDLTIVLHNPIAGTGTEQRLQRLATPEGRRAGIRQVAG